DRVGRQLRLIDRRNRLSSARHVTARPLELWSVQRGELHHRETHVRSLVLELAAKRIGETTERVLRPATGRLERDRTVRERRPDLDDDPSVPRFHQSKRLHRPVYG